MRKLTFAPYAKPEEGEKLPMVVRVWALLFQAVNNPRWQAGEDVLKVRSVARLLDKFETVSVTETKDKQETSHLKFEGADVLLEDAEFERLEDAFKTYRSQVPASAAREVVAVLDFLSGAPTVEALELVK